MPLITTQSAKSYGFSLNTMLSDHVLLGNFIVGAGGASNITFSNIPQTYDHLQFFWNARTVAAATTDFIHVNFNGDSTANYNFDYLQAESGSSGLSPGIGTKAGNTNAWLTQITGGNASANVFGVGTGIIADYSKTNRNKSMHTYGGYDDYGLGTPKSNVRIENSVWFSTSAITSIVFTSDTGSNFAQYTDITLYGIKGA